MLEETFASIFWSSSSKAGVKRRAWTTVVEIASVTDVDQTPGRLPVLMGTQTMR